MHDVRNEVRRLAERDVGGGAAQRGESERVVGEVLAAAVGVRSRRRDRTDAAHPGPTGRGRAGLPARMRAGPPNSDAYSRTDRRPGELRHHGAIAGDQRAHRDVLARERGRQRTRDVGESAGLHEREDLRGDGQYANQIAIRAKGRPERGLRPLGGQRRRTQVRRAWGPTTAKRSSIDCVTRQMPRSVRRKRSASSSGSSPTTSPRGNAHAGIDDHVAQLAAPPDARRTAAARRGRRRPTNARARARTGANCEAPRPRRCSRRTPATRCPCRAARRRRARTSPGA